MHGKTLVIQDENGRITPIKGDPAFVSEVRAEAERRGVPIAALLRYYAYLGKAVDDGKFGEIRSVENVVES